MSRSGASPWRLALCSGWLWLAGCAVAPVQAATAPPLHYRLSIPRPADQYIHIELRIRRPPGKAVDVAMPAWIPGSYRVRDFARHVYDFSAHTPSGVALPWVRTDKQTWRIDHGGQEVVVRYRVFAAEETVRTSHVDDRHASVNGPSVFMYLPGQRSRDCELELDLPEGWQAYGALDPVGPHSYRVADYDALVDAPLELGNPLVRTFQIGATRFDYVLRGVEGFPADVTRLVTDAEHVATALGEEMGGFPMLRYVFLVAINRDGGGGLEHDNSTMIMLRRSEFQGERGYTRAVELAAHELFHAWNVRRIRDAALRPYDYRAETPSELLWFHEGFTESVQELALLRAGLRDADAFLSELATAWTTYLAIPGRNAEPIAAVSRDAWIRAYQPAPNHPNVAVSYYDKGKFLGLTLDIELRLRAAARQQQGDLMGMFRRLMQSHGDGERGLTHRDIVAAASAEAGEDMAWFFERYVLGTEEIPFPQTLARIGVTVETANPWDEDPTARADAGLELAGTRISNIYPDSPGSAAGLMRDDEIIAVDGTRVGDTASFRAFLAAAGPEAQVVLTVFRSDVLREIPVQLRENPARLVRFALTEPASLPPGIENLRTRWLRTRARPPQERAPQE